MDTCCRFDNYCTSVDPSQASVCVCVGPSRDWRVEGASSLRRQADSNRFRSLTPNLYLHHCTAASISVLQSHSLQRTDELPSASSSRVVESSLLTLCSCCPRSTAWPPLELSSRNRPSCLLHQFSSLFSSVLLVRSRLAVSSSIPAGVCNPGAAPLAVISTESRLFFTSSEAKWGTG